jgi:hypothetical protein
MFRGRTARRLYKSLGFKWLRKLHYSVCPVKCTYFVISPTPLLMTFSKLTIYLSILLHTYVQKVKFFVTDICLIIILSVVSVVIIENRDIAVKYKIWNIHTKKERKGCRNKLSDRKHKNFRHLLISVYSYLQLCTYFCENPFTPPSKQMGLYCLVKYRPTLLPSTCI